MEDIVLIGAGGHCRSVIDSIEVLGQYRIAAITDMPPHIGNDVLGYCVEYTDQDLPELFRRGIKNAFITIGTSSTASMKMKEQLFNRIKEIGFSCPSVIDPSAVLSRHIQIDEGVFIAKQCSVNVGVKVGCQAVLNTACIVDHDCFIDSFSFVAPGVTLSGNVGIGRCSFVGAGSTVIQGITIGHHSLIGAGSVVVKNIPENVVAYGNPCRVIRGLNNDK